MSERIQCPSCGAGLVLPDSIQGSAATCPRCLAAITVPEAVRVPSAIQAERPEARDEGAFPHYNRADLDVRRDMRGTSCFVSGLAVVGLLGILFTAWGAFSAAANYKGVIPSDRFIPILYLVGALVFMAGLRTLMVFVRSGGNPGASGPRRVVVGTLALAGGATLVVLLLIVAFIILIVVTCGPGIFGPHRGSPL